MLKSDLFRLEKMIVNPKILTSLLLLFLTMQLLSGCAANLKYKISKDNTIIFPEVPYGAYYSINMATNDSLKMEWERKRYRNFKSYDRSIYEIKSRENTTETIINENDIQKFLRSRQKYILNDLKHYGYNQNNFAILNKIINKIIIQYPYEFSYYIPGHTNYSTYWYWPDRFHPTLKTMATKVPSKSGHGSVPGGFKLCCNKENVFDFKLNYYRIGLFFNLIRGKPDIINISSIAKRYNCNGIAGNIYIKEKKSFFNNLHRIVPVLGGFLGAYYGAKEFELTKNFKLKDVKVDARLILIPASFFCSYISLNFLMNIFIPDDFAMEISGTMVRLNK